MAVEFWVIFSMFAGGVCGLVLGFVIWGLEDDKGDRDIPAGDDW